MSAYRNYFVVPDTVRLDIEGLEGEWIEVKRELRNHDLRVMQSAAIKSIKPADEATGAAQEWTPDLPMISEAKTLAWVTDWSLVDAKDKRVPFSRDAWRNLRPRVADAIVATLDAYTEALDKEQDADPIATSLITSSPSASGWADGPTTTSSPLPSDSPAESVN